MIDSYHKMNSKYTTRKDENHCIALQAVNTI